MQKRASFPLWQLAALTTGLAATGAAVYTLQVEKRWIEQVDITLRLPRLRPAFNNYRIVQISDIHMDGIGMTANHLAQCAEWVNDLKPDLVVLTGDYVTYFPKTFAPMLVDGLAHLSAPDGVLAVLGNHDHQTDAHIVRRELDRAGVMVLNNEVHTLKRDNEPLHIGGVDDVYTENHNLDNVMKALPEDDSPAMLLSHVPDFADTSAQTGRFDLQLSGHSHAGQVRTPFKTPMYLPKGGKKYHTGLYHVDGMLQYTNRGLGSCTPNVRFNCRPEITHITLQTA